MVEYLHTLALKQMQSIPLIFAPIFWGVSFLQMFHIYYKTYTIIFHWQVLEGMSSCKWMAQSFAGEESDHIVFFQLSEYLSLSCTQFQTACSEQQLSVGNTFVLSFSIRKQKTVYRPSLPLKINFFSWKFALSQIALE